MIVLRWCLPAVITLLGPALNAADRVVASPAVVEIASPERVVEYKELTLKTTDGSKFKIRSLRSQRGVVNLIGVIGGENHTCNFLVHLASTVKPGRYSDEIVFELDDKAQSVLRVQVRILISDRRPEPKESLTGIVGND